MANKTVKATKAQVESRITELMGLLVRGASYSDILRYCSEMGAAATNPDAKDHAKQSTFYGVELTSRQIDTYIQRARTAFSKLSESDRKEAIGLAHARLELLFQSTMRIQDFKAALAVEKSRIELLGLNAPTKIAPTNPAGDKPYAELTDEERTSRVMAIVNQARARGAGSATPDGDDDDSDSDDLEA
ncbi:hypothetical protein [Herpetosiphon geysericola]|uniref:hypothetical protein n=1 Tax=Herpetosiphon geysericola TaxID=70996 RepID=UPI0006C90A94|nr:hypothetical protein [Herpetosiphon geysericola]